MSSKRRLKTTFKDVIQFGVIHYHNFTMFKPPEVLIVVVLSFSIYVVLPPISRLCHMRASVIGS